MDSVRQKLKEALDAKGITMAAASRRIGRNHAYIQQFLERETPQRLPEDARKRLAALTDLSETDLGANSTGYTRAAPSSARTQSLPEIDVRAGAGGGGVAIEGFAEDPAGNQYVVDNVKDHWGIPGAYLRHELRTNPQSVYVAEIMGDSMEPTLRSGDRVLIDTAHKAPSPPGVYALWDGFGVVVKRIEIVPEADPAAIRVLSDNQRHTAYQRTLEEAHIIGRVVCRVTAL